MRDQTTVRNSFDLDTGAGASAAPNAPLVDGIAAVLVITIFALGRLVNGLFQDTCDEVTAQPTVASTC